MCGLLSIGRFSGIKEDVMDNILPLEVSSIVERFLRDMSRNNCGVFGLVWQADLEAGAAIIRNSAGDPLEQAEMIVQIIERAQANKLIRDEEI